MVQQHPEDDSDEFDGKQGCMVTLERLWFYVTHTGKQVVPFLLLIGYSLAGAGSFYLLTIYSPVEPSDVLHVHVERCCDWGSNNSYSSSFYFTWTILSTLGYGDKVPCTWLGKLITILIAIIGVPLTLTCLSRLGEILRSSLDHIWTILRKKFGCHHPHSPNPESYFDDEDDEDHLPFLIGLSFLLFWIVVSAFYFQRFLYYPDHQPYDWGFFDIIYFTIISLLTIGFGDYVPSNHGLDYITFFFIFVGLALVSMCVAILQKNVETQFDKFINTMKKISDGESVDLDSDQTHAAAAVLGMWKKDRPTGNWLAPAPRRKAPTKAMRKISTANNNNKKKVSTVKNNPQNEPKVKFGKIIMGAFFTRWKLKTICRPQSRGAQTTSAHSIVGGVSPPISIGGDFNSSPIVQQQQQHRHPSNKNQQLSLHPFINLRHNDTNHSNNNTKSNSSPDSGIFRRVLRRPRRLRRINPLSITDDPFFTTEADQIQEYQVRNTRNSNISSSSRGSSSAPSSGFQSLSIESFDFVVDDAAAVDWVNNQLRRKISRTADDNSKTLVKKSDKNRENGKLKQRHQQQQQQKKSSGSASRFNPNFVLVKGEETLADERNHRRNYGNPYFTDI